MPGKTKENQINAPVSRLLGPDPIYNYGLHWYKDECETPPTIEPCTEMGADPKIVRWFFENYFNNESLAFSYIQLGQENSFGWEAISKGLPMQFEILNEYVKSGKCRVMTMGDTGEWFKRTFEKTPATALIASSNALGGAVQNSIWYDCINYRINIVTENDKLYIRDIYKFCEDYTEAFYDEPCREWNITYDNLPVMDGFLWRREDTDHAGIYFGGSFENIRSYRDGDLLVAEASVSGREIRFEMSEKSIVIYTEDDISFSKKDDCGLVFEKNKIRGVHNGRSYEIGVDGVCSEREVISPVNKKIVFDMSL